MLVLDANILIRAVLGSRVHGLLRKYAGQVEFLTPDTAFAEAREHLPKILKIRNISAAPALATLELMGRLVQTVELETYGSLETHCSWAHPARRGRLARARFRPCTQLPDLDRRHRFLRLRRGNVDHRSG